MENEKKADLKMVADTVKKTKSGRKGVEFDLRADDCEYYELYANGEMIYAIYDPAELLADVYAEDDLDFIIDNLMDGIIDDINGPDWVGAITNTPEWAENTRQIVKKGAPEIKKLMKEVFSRGHGFDFVEPEQENKATTSRRHE